MGQKFTLENSINEIRKGSGPEMDLYLLPAIVSMIPEEFRDRPMKEWIGSFMMPWGFPLDGQGIVEDANMLQEANQYRELIPLWAHKEEFTINTNDRNSVCFISLKNDLEGILPAVIVCPGGGYENIAFHDEGLKTARRLAEAGYRPFILNYRYKPNYYPEPQVDLALAIRYLRANAEKYQIDPDNLMILGYSAGGHLCASTTALRGQVEEALDRELRTFRPDLYNAFQGISIRPDKVCLCYPVISCSQEPHEESFQSLTGGDESLRELLSIEKQVDHEYPKTFIWTVADDSLVPPGNTIRMAEALRKNNIPHKVRIYPTGEHGCSTGDGTSAEGWMGEMTEFMK